MFTKNQRLYLVNKPSKHAVRVRTVAYQKQVGAEHLVTHLRKPLTGKTVGYFLSTDNLLLTPSREVANEYATILRKEVQDEQLATQVKNPNK